MVKSAIWLSSAHATDDTGLSADPMRERKRETPKDIPLRIASCTDRFEGRKLIAGGSSSRQPADNLMMEGKLRFFHHMFERCSKTPSHYNAGNRHKIAYPPRSLSPDGDQVAALINLSFSIAIELYSSTRPIISLRSIYCYLTHYIEVIARGV